MRSAARQSGFAGAAALLMWMAAGPASAQIDPRAPIDITADSGGVVNSECASTWTGSVEALQGRTRLRASAVDIHSVKKADGCGALERLDARGQVFFVTPERTVRADSAQYQFAGQTITLTGDVVVVQGKNVLRGDRLVINTRTGEARMSSTAQGRDSPGRVRGVFYPNDEAPR